MTTTPIHIDKPWGYETIWAQSEQYVGKKLFIRGGNKLSLQYHEVKTETILVLEGAMLLHLQSAPEESVRTRRLQEGDSYHIPPGRIHRFEAPEDVLLVEVSTTELEDVVRLEDEYGRVEPVPSDRKPLE